MSHLKVILKAHNVSVTKPRRLIFEALAAHGPCSTARLADYCPAIDRATVYRTVTLFEKLGVITRVWIGFKSIVELGEAFNPHHHHLVCEQCGRTIELHHPALEKLLTDIAQSEAFTLSHHTVELSGRCQKCQATLPTHL